MKTRIIFIHGNPGSRDIYYQFNDLPYEKTYIDLPGIGYSKDKPPKSLDDLVKSANDQAQANLKNEEEIIFFGHDWGVPVSIALACKLKNVVRGFVFFNTAIGELDKLPVWLKAFQIKSLGPFFVSLAALFGTKNKKGLVFRPYLNLRVFNPGYYVSLVFSLDFTSFSTIISEAKNTGVFEKPCFIAWGYKDLCLNEYHLVDLERKFKNSKVILKACRHFVPLDLSNEDKQQVINFIEGKKITNHCFVVELLNENFRKLHSEPCVFDIGSPAIRMFTFGDLNVLAYKFQSYLRSKNLTGKLVLLAVRPWHIFISLFVACLREGAIPVMLDPKIEINNLIRALRGLPDFHVASSPFGCLLIGALSLNSNLHFCFGSRLLGMTAGHGTKIDDVLFVAFTSGGTGIPKPVVFTERMVLSQKEIFAERLKMSAFGIDLPITPAFFIFSLLAGRAVILDSSVRTVQDIDFLKLLKVCRTFKPSLIFGSKFFWKSFLEHSYLSDTNVDFISAGIISGAPLYRAFVKRLADISNIHLVGAYGSTEALPVTFYDLNQSLSPERGLYVGKTVDGVSIKLINKYQIWVTGPNVSERYLVEDLNSSFKLKEDGKVYHKMSDLGYLKDGFLYLLGRENDSAVSDNLFPYPIEDFILSNFKVDDCVCLFKNGLTVICVKGTETEDAIEFEVKKNFNISKVIVKKVESIPYDLRHNSKVLRSKIRI